MEDVYIKKQNALYNIDWALENHDDVYDAVKHTVSEDVMPVKRGRWEHNSDFPDRFICYGCGAMFDMWKHEQRLFNYCPNCGAKMDGE